MLAHSKSAEVALFARRVAFELPKLCIMQVLRPRYTAPADVFALCVCARNTP